MLTKLKNKTGKFIAQYFPLNRVRIWGLRLCGFTICADTYIGPDLFVASMISDQSCWLKIGSRVAIGPRVTLILSSDANSSKLMETIEPIRGGIQIEDDAWIGAGAIILPNITIGRMSIIGAGTIVTKSVPAYSVVVGNPGRIIKIISSD